MGNNENESNFNYYIKEKNLKGQPKSISFEEMKII